MIPYLTFPTLPIAGVKPFGLLVATGILAGYLVAIRRASQAGIPKEEITSLVIWTVFPALLGSHVLQVLMYYPEKAINNPMSLLKFNTGISSFGGIFSFAFFFYLYQKLRKEPRDSLVLIDILTQGFVFGWIFGRLACALAHDHPGIASDFFLAVKFPEGPRHDLGTYEFLYTVFVLVPASLVTRKLRSANGMQLVVFGLLYSPFRLICDALRTNDTRYFGWTPGQYSSVALFLFTLWLWRHVRRRHTQKS